MIEAGIEPWGSTPVAFNFAKLLAARPTEPLALSGVVEVKGCFDFMYLYVIEVWTHFYWLM